MGNAENTPKDRLEFAPATEDAAGLTDEQKQEILENWAKLEEEMGDGVPFYFFGVVKSLDIMLAGYAKIHEILEEVADNRTGSGRACEMISRITSTWVQGKRN